MIICVPDNDPELIPVWVEMGRIMYHGTSREASAKIKKEGFRQSPGGMLGRGVYLSPELKKVRAYPKYLSREDRVVIKVEVNLGKVIEIRHQGHRLQKTWHDHGYDTAWCPPESGMVPSGLEEYCVWDPHRIKVLEVNYPYQKRDIREAIQILGDIFKS